MSLSLSQNLTIVLREVCRASPWLSLEERPASIVLHCGRCNGLETFSIDFLTSKVRMSDGSADIAIKVLDFPGVHRHIMCGSQQERFSPPVAMNPVQQRAIAAWGNQQIRDFGTGDIAPSVQPERVERRATVVSSRRFIDLSDEE